MHCDLDRSLSSDQYHGLKGSFSSSQLKTILEDPELFYKSYISKEIGKKESSSFDVGTYFHTAVLEPHLIDQECIVFEGAIRRGKVWDEFKEIHAGKAIITKAEKETCLKLVEAVNTSPIARSYLDGYENEISAFVTVHVFDGKIYYLSKTNELFILKRKGWTKETEIEFEILSEFGTAILLKVRADSISFSKGIISDLRVLPEIVSQSIK